MNRANLPIGTPCNVDFASMTPADRGRFCGDCKKVVHELSRMTERDARDLVRSAKNGELCVRYAFDMHGKVFFADTPRNVVPSALLNRAKRAAVAAAVIAAPMALAACGGGGEIMGDMVSYVDDKVVTEDPDPGADPSGDAGAGGDADAGDAKGDGGADASKAGDAASDSYVPPQ